jgi:hypothetical protein
LVTRGVEHHAARDLRQAAPLPLFPINPDDTQAGHVVRLSVAVIGEEIMPQLALIDLPMVWQSPLLSG